MLLSWKCSNWVPICQSSWKRVFLHGKVTGLDNPFYAKTSKAISMPLGKSLTDFFASFPPSD